MGTRWSLVVLLGAAFLVAGGAAAVGVGTESYGSYCGSAERPVGVSVRTLEEPARVMVGVAALNSCDEVWIDHSLDAPF